MAKNSGSRSAANRSKRSRDVNASTAEQHEKTPAGGAVHVRATRQGFHGGQRRREGQEFTIESEKEFSSEWMERIGGASVSGKAETKPARTGGRASAPAAPATTGDPLGD